MPAPGVHTRLFDGELVILDLQGGEYMALDAIGAALWQGIEAGQSVTEVAEQIVAEYDVSLKRATADLDALLKDFLVRGLFVETAAR